MLAFWHAFVEPFFGRGQRQYSPLHTKTQMQQLEAEEHVEKQSSSSDEQEEPKGKAGVAGLQLPWLVGLVLYHPSAAVLTTNSTMCQLTCHPCESIPFWMNAALLQAYSSGRAVSLGISCQPC